MAEHYTVVANDLSGPQHPFCLIITVEAQELDFDPVTAIQDAALEFLETETGKAIAEKNGGQFNYGDFVVEVPEPLCKKHGFIITDVISTEHVVEHNENLNNLFG